jgi:hypothetical protein
MIKAGLEENSIMKLSGSRVKTLMKQLGEYEKNNPTSCPLIKKRKR